MKNIVFHELAEKELLSSRDFYDELTPYLGMKFILEVEHIIHIIKNNPLTFPIYFKNYRKALLRKFPYSIIYRIENERVLILAIAHERRKPNYFASR